MNYDYIIVGAGAAGCVLANRLSEDPQTRVLLVEAGGSDDRFLIRLPLGLLRAFRDPTLTWGYVSEPELHLMVARCPCRGRVHGGSSSINGMFFMPALQRLTAGSQLRTARGWVRARAAVFQARSGWRGRAVSRRFRAMPHRAGLPHPNYYGR
jgi:choline dehydrogenase